MLTHPTYRIGDTLRFPLGKLGEEHVYRHRWAITAFSRDGVHVRRLADGVSRIVAEHWIRQYLTEEQYRPQRVTERVPAAALAALQARRRRELAWQTDPAAPSYYVTARRGEQWTALYGPFADHYSALQLVREGHRAVLPFDRYLDIGVGTAKVQDGRIQGKFNQQIRGEERTA